MTPGVNATKRGEERLTPGEIETKRGEKRLTPGVNATKRGEKRLTPGVGATKRGVNRLTPGVNAIMPKAKRGMSSASPPVQGFCANFAPSHAYRRLSIPPHGSSSGSTCPPGCSCAHGYVCFVHPRTIPGRTSISNDL